MSRASRAISLFLGLVLLMVLSGASLYDDLESRLSELRPEEPMAYFELAEEIADAAEEPEQRALARRLFALSGVLAPEQLGRSACLALADMEEDEQNRRRLMALASLFGSDDLSQAVTEDWGASPIEKHTASAVLAVTEAMSHYRRGRGSQAMAALRKPGAMELLEECEDHLPGGINRFMEDCKLYRGRLRPNLSEDHQVRMLRFEIALLTGSDRPWSSELLYGRGRPLIEVDPLRLEEAFGVDGSRPIHRDGKWVEDAR